MKAIWRGFSSLLADGIQAYLDYKRAGRDPIFWAFWNH